MTTSRRLSRSALRRKYRVVDVQTLADLLARAGLPENVTMDVAVAVYAFAPPPKEMQEAVRQAVSDLDHVLSVLGQIGHASEEEDVLLKVRDWLSARAPHRKQRMRYFSTPVEGEAGASAISEINYRDGQPLGGWGRRPDRGRLLVSMVDLLSHGASADTKRSVETAREVLLPLIEEGPPDVDSLVIEYYRSRRRLMVEGPDLGASPDFIENAVKHPKFFRVPVLRGALERLAEKGGFRIPADLEPPSAEFPEATAASNVEPNWKTIPPFVQEMKQAEDPVAYHQAKRAEYQRVLESTSRKPRRRPPRKGRPL